MGDEAKSRFAVVRAEIGCFTKSKHSKESEMLLGQDESDELNILIQITQM